MVDEKTSGWKVLSLVCWLAASSLAIAQEEPGAADPTTPTVGVDVVEEAEGEPIGGGEQAEPPAVVTAPPTVEPFDIDQAVEAYLARMTPEEKERSDNYFEGGYWLQLWNFLIAMAVAWLLLSTRLSAGMRNFAERLTRFRPLQTAIYAVQYTLFITVLTFPMTLYQGFFREHKYELATQTFGAWMGDQFKGLMIGLIFGAVLWMVLYGIFRRAPRTWWLWGGAVSVVFLIVLLLLGPIYIDPLFNDYTLLEDERVLDPILAMAHEKGIDVDRVYQFDASRQTNRISANVSGFMGTMRIRLNDNLLNRCTLPEIKSVMGHEMGHYVLNHIYRSLVFFGFSFLLGFAFMKWAFGRIVERYGDRWDVRGIGDVAGLPLLVALFTFFFFIMTPIFNTYIRTNESEADFFGLEASREPDGFAEVALKLGEYRKMDPGPIEEWIFFDHPSGRARIAMSMQWKADHLDELRSR